MAKSTKAVTIVNVAALSGVSSSLAAAVLRGTKCNIGCSAPTRKRVLNAAKSLGYQRNELARALRRGMVPLIAFCIHNVVPRGELNPYVYDLLLGATLTLREEGFNTIFVAYDTAADLIEQTRPMIDGKLVSGVISNLPPDGGGGIIEYLRERGLPSVVLGDVEDSPIPCVASRDTALDRELTRYAAELDLGRVVKLLAKGKLEGSGLDWAMSEITPKSDGKRHMTPLGSVLDADPGDKNTLWVALGELTRRTLADDPSFRGGNIVSVENKRLLVQSGPTFLVHSKEFSRAGKAADILLEWIVRGNKPAPLYLRMDLEPEEVEFIGRPG